MSICFSGFLSGVKKSSISIFVGLILASSQYGYASDTNETGIVYEVSGKIDSEHQVLLDNPQIVTYLNRDFSVGGRFGETKVGSIKDDWIVDAKKFGLNGGELFGIYSLWWEEKQDFIKQLKQGGIPSLTKLFSKYFDQKSQSEKLLNGNILTTQQDWDGFAKHVGLEGTGGELSELYQLWKHNYITPNVPSKSADIYGEAYKVYNNSYQQYLAKSNQLLQQVKTKLINAELVKNGIVKPVIKPETPMGKRWVAAQSFYSSRMLEDAFNFDYQQIYRATRDLRQFKENYYAEPKREKIITYINNKLEGIKTYGFAYINLQKKGNRFTYNFLDMQPIITVRGLNTLVSKTRNYLTTTEYNNYKSLLNSNQFSSYGALRTSLYSSYIQGEKDNRIHQASKTNYSADIYKYLKKHRAVKSSIDQQYLNFHNDALSYWDYASQTATVDSDFEFQSVNLVQAIQRHLEYKNDQEKRDFQNYFSLLYKDLSLDDLLEILENNPLETGTDEYLTILQERSKLNTEIKNLWSWAEQTHQQQKYNHSQVSKSRSRAAIREVATRFDMDASKPDIENYFTKTLWNEVDKILINLPKLTPLKSTKQIHAERLKILENQVATLGQTLQGMILQISFKLTHGQYKDIKNSAQANNNQQSEVNELYERLKTDYPYISRVKGFLLNMQDSSSKSPYFQEQLNVFIRGFTGNKLKDELTNIIGNSPFLGELHQISEEYKKNQKFTWEDKLKSNPSLIGSEWVTEYGWKNDCKQLGVGSRYWRDKYAEHYQSVNGSHTGYNGSYPATLAELSKKAHEETVNSYRGWESCYPRHPLSIKEDHRILKERETAIRESENKFLIVINKQISYLNSLQVKETNELLKTMAWLEKNESGRQDDPLTNAVTEYDTNVAQGGISYPEETMPEIMHRFNAERETVYDQVRNTLNQQISEITYNDPFAYENSPDAISLQSLLSNMRFYSSAEGKAYTARLYDAKAKKYWEEYNLAPQNVAVEKVELVALGEINPLEEPTEQVIVLSSSTEQYVTYSSAQELAANINQYGNNGVDLESDPLWLEYPYELRKTAYDIARLTGYIHEKGIDNVQYPRSTLYDYYIWVSAVEASSFDISADYFDGVIPSEYDPLSLLGVKAKWSGGKLILKSGYQILKSKLVKLKSFINLVKVIPSKVKDTLTHIRKTGNAPPGFKGGGIFENDGRHGGQVLSRVDKAGNPITYKKYDVNPFQKGVGRGEQRLVLGSNGKSYYTKDHFKTFTSID